MTELIRRTSTLGHALVAGTFLGAVGLAVVASARQPQALDRETESAVRELAGRADEVGDLSARYEERKHTALLKKPLVTRGRVRIVGHRARWDAEAPHRTVTLLDQSEVRIYYPERSMVEVYPIAAHLQFPTVSPLPRWKELAEHFRVEPRSAQEGDPQGAAEHLLLRLTPVQPALRDYVATVDVAIDRSSGLLRQAEITDPDGDRTVMLFSDVQTNTGLAPHDLDLDLPAGTQVVRPLSAGKSDEKGGD
jgi:outer membrane lipoprotein-sorting protein